MYTTFSGALREALKEAMRKDDTIFVIGEDVGPYGGIYNVTRGLYKEFGSNRVIDAPMCEATIVGAGIGAAISGMRPVVEIMYADFLAIAMDQIVNNAAKMFFLSGGRTKVPLVVRANCGTGSAEGAHHTQSVESWFMNVPGLKIVVPSTPEDARGLLLGSIWDDNPVIFLEHKRLYQMKGEINSGGDLISLGKADIKRNGKDITVATCGFMVLRTLEAAEKLNTEGYDVEVVDVRTLKPFDEELLYSSVKKTGRFLTVEENPYFGGWGLQLIDGVITNCFKELKNAPKRLGGRNVPIPAKKEFEDFVIPDTHQISESIRNIIEKT